MPSELSKDIEHGFDPEVTLGMEGHGHIQEVAPMAQTGTPCPLPGHLSHGGRNRSWPFPEWTRYRCRACIGQGATGVVFKVDDPRLNRTVAMKVLHESALAHAGAFLREARALAKVVHPNVAKVHEVGEVNGRPYFTMQFLQGDSLQNIGEQFTLAERVEILRQTCEGVHAAHGNGLLHRDLKPANIMVEKDPEGHLHAYVVDFGMAGALQAPCRGDCESNATQSLPSTDAFFPLMNRQEACQLPPDQQIRFPTLHLNLDLPSFTQISTGLSGGRIMGTPAFMSPEQAEGAALDQRSDVYSLGSTLYATLTGRLPFPGESLHSTIGKVAQSRPDSPRSFNAAIPRDLEAIIRKAMEKDPHRRYPSAKALGTELERWSRGDAVEALTANPIYCMYRWLKKNRVLATTGALLGISLLAASALGLQENPSTNEQAKYYQFFGQEAERLEAALALSESIPLHDTQPERQAIKEKISHLEYAIAHSGSVAEAPGLYAVGRGYLVLENWKAARQSLERAWELGLQTPEMAFALVTCLVSIYQDELQDLPSLTRAERKKQLDKTLKPSIQSFLTLARQGSQSATTAYAEALLAKIEGRFEEAIAKADQTLKKQPWRVHAVILKASAYYERAMATPPGLKDLERASALLEQARYMARSCCAVYELEAWIQFRKMQHAATLRRNFMSGMGPLMESLRNAKKANSRSWNASLLEAQALLWSRDETNDWYWSQEKDQRRMPETMQRVISCTDKVLESAPNSTQALSIKGCAFWVLAQWEQKRGIDPRRSLDKAIEIFSKALQKARFQAATLINLGTCSAIKGDWELANGRDPASSYGEALRHYTEAESTVKNSALSYNMAMVRKNIARCLCWQGIDPQSMMEAAWKDISRSKVLAPHKTSDDVLAEFQLQKAEYAIWQGNTDTAAILEGRRYAEIAIRQNPGDPKAMKALAWSHLLASLTGNYDADLDLAERMLEMALRATPKDAGLLYHHAWLALERFRRAPSRKGYQAMESRITKALKRHDAMPELHFLAMEACRLAMKHGVRAIPPSSWRERMETHHLKALLMNPLVKQQTEKLLATTVHLPL